MNLNDAPLGHAFDDDYPESYGGLGQQYSASLQRQIAELEQTSSSSGAASTLALLDSRRSGRNDVLQFETVQRPSGPPNVLGRGQLVMPVAAYRMSGIADLMLSNGFTDQGDPQSEYVRWQTTVLENIDPVIADCQALGGQIWRNCLMSMAAIGKGLGGPEPIPGLGRFADYQIPSAPDNGPGPRAQVAVIDTGIPSLLDEGRYPGMSRTDGWLANVERRADNRDLLDDFPNGPDTYLDFQAGHGTFVAGIIQRVAPNADIRVYRAADSEGFATDHDIAVALLRAVNEGAQIVNLSLAGRTANDEPPPAIAAVVQRIQQTSGGAVVIVAAAGNYGDSVPCWPAALDGVEAVAGLTADLGPTSWSSTGSHIRFSTVGEGIRSTFVTGQESPVFDPDPDTFGVDAWAFWSGTSFAAPQIAGAVARICYECALTPRQAVDRLHERSRPITDYGSAMQILRGIQ